MPGNPPPTLGHAAGLQSGPRAHGPQPGIRHKLVGFSEIALLSIVICSISMR